MMYVFVVNPKTPGLKTTVKLDTPAWHTVALRMDSQEAALCQRTAMLQDLSDISVKQNCYAAEAVNLPASLPALSDKSTTCVIHTEPPARPYGRPIGYMCYTESVKPDLEV